MHIRRVGLALLPLGWQGHPALGQAQKRSISTGVVATITPLDANTGLATLQIEAGEVFELPKESLYGLSV